MSDLLFMSPLFKERIWGGQSLHHVFGYDLPSEKTGECWCVSGLDHGASTIRGGCYDGTPLNVLYRDQQTLFGPGYGPSFPILVKLLDAKADLSVQVHPGDQVIDGVIVPGKSECWYVLDTEPEGAVILGHTALTKESFSSLVHAGQWDQLLVRKPIKAKDVIDVPAGTVHAILKNTMILETQQPSDVTYRLFDYNRTDDQGQKRELHLPQALQFTRIPHQPAEQPPLTLQKRGSVLTRHIANRYFNVWEWTVRTSLTITHQPFLVMSCLAGVGTINGQPFHKGDHLIKTIITDEITIEGQSTWIVSHPIKHPKEEHPHAYMEFR